MSHEGIRFVSSEGSEPEEQQKLGGDAIQPAKVRVDKSGGTGMVIEWKDGHRSSWSFEWLRAACPCATCYESRKADGRAPGISLPRSALSLKVYPGLLRPIEVKQVGNYAVGFTWSDGHKTGLYSWDYLRNVCDVQARRQGVSAA